MPMAAMRARRGGIADAHLFIYMCRHQAAETVQNAIFLRLDSITTIC